MREKTEKKEKKDKKEEKRRKTVSRASVVMKNGEDETIKTSRRSSSSRSESRDKESGSSKDNQNRRSSSSSKSRKSSMEDSKKSSSRSLSKSSKQLLPTSNSFDSLANSRSSLSKRASTMSPRISRRSLSKSGNSKLISEYGLSPGRLSIKNGSSKSLSRDLQQSLRKSIGKSGSSNSLAKYSGRKSSKDRMSLSEAKQSSRRTSLVDETETKKKSKKIRCSLCRKAEASMSVVCEHKFCARCFMNVVYKPLESPNVNDGYLVAPTIGRCPMCRCEVQKYQVRLCKDHKVTPRLALRDDKLQIRDSSIGGKVFVPKEKDPRFCFDEDQPYIDLKEAVDADKVNWVLNDGSPVPNRVVFEDGCFFDEESRTFHGKIKWPVTFRGAYEWDVVLVFKEGCNVMRVGVIHERKERVLDEAYFKDATEEEIVRLQYPLDGHWKLIWKDVDNNERTYKVTVKNNGFRQGRFLFNFNMSDPRNLFFRWPGDTATAVVESGVNLMRNPMGPEIGGVVCWKTGHPNFPHGFTWERLTFGEMPVQGTLHFGGYAGRNGKQLFSISETSDSGFDNSETVSETDSEDFLGFDDLGHFETNAGTFKSDSNQALHSWTRYSQILDTT